MKHKVKIALVGKYVQLHDAYLSVSESLKHAGLAVDSDVQIDWVNSENVNRGNVREYLGDVDGILVPGGFGGRGIQGKMVAAQFARENNIPYFGICLGMQIACIEIAQNVCGLEDASSTEWSETTSNPIISLLPDQNDVIDMGGTLRLGNWPCHLIENTKAADLYQSHDVLERHRHRYEFNNAYRTVLEDYGVVFSGVSPDNRLVEIIELKDHPYFVACQFHPEFKSRPNRAHPLFKGFMEASLQHKLNHKI